MTREELEQRAVVLRERQRIERRTSRRQAAREAAGKRPLHGNDAWKALGDDDRLEDMGLERDAEEGNGKEMKLGLLKHSYSVCDRFGQMVAHFSTLNGAVDTVVNIGHGIRQELGQPKSREYYVLDRMTRMKWDWEACVMLDTRRKPTQWAGSD